VLCVCVVIQPRWLLCVMCVLVMRVRWRVCVSFIPHFYCGYARVSMVLGYVVRDVWDVSTPWYVMSNGSGWCGVCGMG